MESSRLKTKQSVAALLNDLSTQELKEAVDFILFLKTRSMIDPSQTYFWTKRWQSKERKAERSKKHKRVIGDGSVASLLNELKS